MSVTHHIDIYDSLNSRLIGEECHIVYVLERAAELNRFQSVTVKFDEVIEISRLSQFEPGIRSLTERALSYKTGDFITVGVEVEYIETCFKLIFNRSLHKRELQKPLANGLVQGVTFWLDTATQGKISFYPPTFPKEAPSVIFSPSKTKSFVFPSCDDEKSKSK